jgi:hypothetical protein
MPLQATSGAASYDAFGGGAVVGPVYVEDVFSTYLYTGNGATGQSVNNGIDLSGKGGFVWLKDRDQGFSHFLFDTVRGTDKALNSNTTDAQGSGGLMSATSTGFSFSGNTNGNQNTVLWASWTFRKQPKFFDIQTWTGSGANRTISHSLGSVPACIIVKRTDTTADWAVYHRSLANTQYLVLNSTAAAATGATWWNSTTPTSSVFSLGTDASVNASGGTYIAYIFAHDAGGFGLTGTDNVISCGSYTGNISGDNINLGWEPQWLLFRSANATDPWRLVDNMRGWTADNTSKRLQPNSNSAEDAFGNMGLTATGFKNAGIYNSSDTVIYIAIRRGPMKVPTTGTSVYNAIARTGTGAAATVTGVGFAPDLLIEADRATSASNYKLWWDRLRGIRSLTSANGTIAEQSFTDGVTAYGMDGISLGNDASGNYINISGVTYINWFFRRAPSFFDEVCYTGTGVLGRTVTHNLTTVPELIIIKDRGNVENWAVYSAPVGNTKELYFNRDNAPTASNNGYWNSTTPTSTVFSVGSSGVANNDSGVNYVAYLFSTCAGVSKVGSYTGTGTTLQINCGFTAGARFVLIKRTDSTGDWYVWDTARGIVAGNDPYLLLNSTAAEVTSTDYIDTYSAGFEISSTAPAAINANGGTYIFLAIA